jgi:hypothetical protein
MFWYWIQWQAEARPFSKYLFGGMYDETTELLLYNPHLIKEVI